MRVKKLIASLALAIGGIGMSGAALSSTITNTDGALNPFGGFDWDSAGFAWTTGFTGVDGSNFTLQFGAWATSIKAIGGSSFIAPHLDNVANGVAQSVGGFLVNTYEYTVYATLNETIITCAALNSCTFQVTGGTFDIYYDLASNADTGTGLGFTDGTKIISGTFDAALPTEFSNFTGGQADLTGVVTYTNAAFINPALVGTNVSSTLQLVTTNVTFPPAFDSNGDGVADMNIPSNDPTVVRLQADANQTFTSAVPEPSALLLAGIALAGCGLVGRRRKGA